MNTLTIRTFFKELVLHLVIFSLICILYYIMMMYPGTPESRVFREFLYASPTLIYGITYCILFYHLFFKKILLHAPLKTIIIRSIIITTSFFIIDMINLNLLIESRKQLDSIIWFSPTSLFRFLIFTAYAVTYSFIKGFAWLSIQRVKNEKERISATLNNLRSQIDPHFIFNSLNSVYALSLDEKAQKTSESIEELSGLFRYSLKESNADKVPIQDELDFIEKYIHLHRIRLQEDDKIKLNTTIYWDKKPALIAPLIIINFIENAFKYGISLNKASFVEIHIKVEKATLYLKVRNSMHQGNDRAKNGFGLINARNRLDLLYPGNHSLEVKQNETIHEVVLDINLTRL